MFPVYFGVLLPVVFLSCCNVLLSVAFFVFVAMCFLGAVAAGREVLFVNPHAVFPSTIRCESLLGPEFINNIAGFAFYYHFLV